MIELPSYLDVEGIDDEQAGSWDIDSKRISFGKKSGKRDTERKKGTPWTEEEHRYIFVRFFFWGQKGGFLVLWRLWYNAVGDWKVLFSDVHLVPKKMIMQKSMHLSLDVDRVVYSTRYVTMYDLDMSIVKN
ncbi:hypothetical protein QQ045_021570 [Rhodiola kirilowii]